jgi:hypothetical protein
VLIWSSYLKGMSHSLIHAMDASSDAGHGEILQLVLLKNLESFFFFFLIGEKIITVILAF